MANRSLAPAATPAQPAAAPVASTHLAPKISGPAPSSVPPRHSNAEKSSDSYRSTKPSSNLPPPNSKPPAAPPGAPDFPSNTFPARPTANPPTLPPAPPPHPKKSAPHTTNVQTIPHHKAPAISAAVP